MKKIFKSTVLFLCVFLLCLLTACKDEDAYFPSRDITVVLLNGEHYSVLGDNKKTVKNSGSATFEIELDKGYRAVSFFGDDCIISENISFKQTVTFTDVNYNLTAQIQTEELSVSEFEVVCDANMGEVDINSKLGSAGKDEYYDCDILDLVATPKSGNRFVCWSVGNYIKNGGSFYGQASVIENIDFASIGALYANFEHITNTKKSLVYKFDNGIEIDQDCSVQIEHHNRANTLTAVDMRENGVDCDSRYLAGWSTEDGEYIGLGSRIAIADEDVILIPVWKDYSASENFTFENGVITKFNGTADSDGSVVIPNMINGETVTGIGANAFENCSARTYYIPDTVTTVEDNAFLNCKNLSELYISDNIADITDNAFKGCVNFETLHINAYYKPKHIKEQVSVVSDVYDRLAMNSHNGVRKVVVLGGSGTQAGYSCSVISDMFKEQGETVEVYNFGWSAAYCGLAQFEVLNTYLGYGDIFIHAPEHYNGVMCGNTALSPITGETGIALTDGDPYIYRFSEINWDFISCLTVNEYSNLFTMLAKFNSNRRRMPDCEYSDYCSDVVEEGYGYRPTNEQVFTENGVDKSFGGKLDILSYVNRFELIKNYMYDKIPDGVITFVTFPAMNRSNLLLTYGDEESVKIAAEEYTRQVKDILKDMSIEVLLTQYDTVYDGRFFYNHDYHLGYPTRDAHTEKVIAALLGSHKI